MALNSFDWLLSRIEPGATLSDIQREIEKAKRRIPRRMTHREIEEMHESVRLMPVLIGSVVERGFLLVRYHETGRWDDGSGEFMATEDDYGEESFA